MIWRFRYTQNSNKDLIFHKMVTLTQTEILELIYKERDRLVALRNKYEGKQMGFKLSHQLIGVKGVLKTIEDAAIQRGKECSESEKGICDPR